MKRGTGKKKENGGNEELRYRKRRTPRQGKNGREEKGEEGAREKERDGGGAGGGGGRRRSLRGEQGPSLAPPRTASLFRLARSILPQTLSRARSIPGRRRARTARGPSPPPPANEPAMKAPGQRVAPNHGNCEQVSAGGRRSPLWPTQIAFPTGARIVPWPKHEVKKKYIYICTFPNDVVFG